MFWTSINEKSINRAITELVLCVFALHSNPVHGTFQHPPRPLPPDYPATQISMWESTSVFTVCIFIPSLACISPSLHLSLRSSPSLSRMCVRLCILLSNLSGLDPPTRGKVKVMRVIRGLWIKGSRRTKGLRWGSKCRWIYSSLVVLEHAWDLTLNLVDVVNV